MLDWDTYGKTGVRLTQVLHDSVVEISVTVLFEGDFAGSYTEADNSKVLPTDTIKNTVYVIARQNRIESIERFARDLAQHFLANVSHLNVVRIEIDQASWSRIDRSNAAYMRTGTESRVTSLIASRSGFKWTSGIENLELLKASNSAFTGFLKDNLTTLAETRDRLLGTSMNARWTYRDGSETDFNECHQRIRITLLEAFAAHHSESVQHTLYDMGKRALEKFSVLKSIHITMPNKHRLLVDLSRFGLDNANQIFVPTDEPSGYIEACLVSPD